MAEELGKGLQNPVHGCESRSRLQSKRLVMKKSSNPLWLVISIILVIIFPPAGIVALLSIAYLNRAQRPIIFKIALAFVIAILLILVFIFFIFDKAVHFTF